MLSIQTFPQLESHYRQKVLLALFGALYPLGFAPFNLWPLSFLSIILLLNEVLVCLDRSSQFISKLKPNKQKQSGLSLFSIGLYWSFGAFGVGVSWVYVSIHEYGHAPIIGAVGISFLFVLTLSLIKAIGISFIGKMVKWFGLGMFILILPFVWVVFEFVQTLLFSGFPWLFAGYTQIDGPMWMLSTWIGVYGVSWFMLAISACLVVLLRGYWANRFNQTQSNSLTSKSIILLTLISVPVLALLSPTESIQPDKKSIDVALVQPNISQNIKWDRRYFSQIVDVLDQQSHDHWDAELIVWPEGAIPAYQHQVEDILDDLNKQALKRETDLLLGIPVYHSEDVISYSAFISVGAYPQTYHKQVLVPFGEYVPFGRALRGLIEFFNLPMSSFSPATSKQHPMDFAQYQVIPAICYEITYPDIVHELIVDADSHSQKPKLLVTVSNDAWFGDSFGPYQHMQMARMRALELGIPLIRSTNDGVTAIVDARGQVLKKLNRYEQSTLRYKVSLNHYQTLYRQYGLAGIYLLLIISAVVFSVSWFIHRKVN